MLVKFPEFSFNEIYYEVCGHYSITWSLLVVLSICANIWVEKGLFLVSSMPFRHFVMLAFDLLGDSMVPYQNSPYLLLVISFLI